MSDIREFLVQGSDPLPYKVIFKKDGGDLKATCTCKAGSNGILCKHRLSILDGEKGGKPPSVRRLKSLGCGAWPASIVACHAHVTPTKRRPAFFGSLNITPAAPRHSAANAMSPIRHS
jgi:hypothetical protein